MFIDTAKVYVKAGDGGKGVTSFYRDKFTRFPIPDGGNGGDGGDVIIKVDRHVHTLMDFQYRRHFRAESGGHGSGKNKKGRRGKDCIIKVPPGTVVKDAGTMYLLRDMIVINDEVIVVNGGNGGRGNSGSRTVTDGGKGEERHLYLELKLLADAGIIGYPNSGKSSLISRISNAHPKVASFPFTTLAPVLGIVNVDEEHFVAADIPGLIEGAHSGRGLGINFLKHIERTHLLLHIIDMAGVDGRNPVEDYKSLNMELKLYSEELAGKPQIVAANKMDLPQAKENLKDFRSKVKVMEHPTGWKVYPISCKTGEGIDNLISDIARNLKISEKSS